MRYIMDAKKNKYVQKYLIIFICFLCLPVYAEELIKTEVQDIKKTKQEILYVVEKENATDEEKAILLAVASIETENFSNDYPKGDSKQGDAYNVSLYKMNIGMIRDIDNSINPQNVHNDVKLATDIMLKGIRKFGVNKFLTYHRGGAGAFTGAIPSKDIKPYINAVKAIAAKYSEDKKQLSPDTTDNTRYTILVPAI